MSIIKELDIPLLQNASGEDGFLDSFLFKMIEHRR